VRQRPLLHAIREKPVGPIGGACLAKPPAVDIARADTIWPAFPSGFRPPKVSVNSGS
jgi:hypothetical protein